MPDIAGIHNYNPFGMMNDNQDFAKTLDESGMKYTYTDDIGEARKSIFKFSVNLWLPNIIKYPTILTNVPKVENGINTLKPLGLGSTGVEPWRQIYRSN